MFFKKSRRCVSSVALPGSEYGHSCPVNRISEYVGKETRMAISVGSQGARPTAPNTFPPSMPDPRAASQAPQLQSSLERGYLFGVAYSPDGKTIATFGKGRTIRLWDVHSGLVRITLGKHNGGIKAVSWAPDGLSIASGGIDGMIKVWNADDGHQIGHDLEGHAASVNAVAFSPDGTLIASVSGDLMHSDNSLRVWSARAQDCVIGPLISQEACIRSVMFCSASDQHLLLVSWSDGGSIRLWSARDGSCICQLSGEDLPASSMSVTPSGSRLAVGFWDGAIEVWNLSAMESSGGCEAAAAMPALIAAKRRIEGHASAVVCTRFSPDGARLASAGWDAAVRVWDASTGRPPPPAAVAAAEPMHGHAGCVRAVAWSVGGGALASVGDDSTVRLWDPGTCQPIVAGAGAAGGAGGAGGWAGHTGQAWYVAFSPDGNTLATADRDGSVLIWDMIRSAARLAVAMALHPRLGAASPLAAVEPGVLAAVCNLLVDLH